MNTITRKYLQMFKGFDGTFEEFVSTIPEKDKSRIHWLSLRNEVKRLELRRGRPRGL